MSTDGTENQFLGSTYDMLSGVTLTSDKGSASLLQLSLGYFCLLSVIAIIILHFSHPYEIDHFCRLHIQEAKS